MTAPVFLASSSELTNLNVSDTYVLRGAEGRHARTVQRLRTGERLDIVDGAGLRLHCEVAPLAASATKDELPVTVLAREAEPKPNPTITLVQGLAKGDASELAITQAVEVGVDAIVPWQSARSVVVWRSDRAAKSLGKWEAAVSRAVKQSRRAYLPPVGPAVDTPQLAALVREAEQAGGIVLVLDGDADVSLAQAPLPADGSVMVIVGPEGGISADEIGRLTAAGATLVTAGRHIMRSSTAGAVAIGALSLRMGRWDTQ